MAQPKAHEPTVMTRIATIAAVVTLLGACSSAAPGTPSATVAPPTAALTLAPTSPPSTAATPSPTAPPIADGTYISAPMQVAAMRAAINADSKLTAAAKSDLINNELALDDHKTSLVYMTFALGQWTEQGSYDDGPREVGAKARYAFPDDHTLVLQESCCVITYRVTWSGKSFRLKRLSETTTLNEETEAIASRLLFETTPFTLEP